MCPSQPSPMGHPTRPPSAPHGRDRGTQTPEGQVPRFWDGADITGRWRRPPSLRGRLQDGAPRPRACVGGKGCLVASLKAENYSKMKPSGREAAGKPHHVGTRREVTTAGVLPGPQSPACAETRGDRRLRLWGPGWGGSWDGGCPRPVLLASVCSGGPPRWDGGSWPPWGDGWHQEEQSLTIPLVWVQHGDPQVLTRTAGEVGGPGVLCTSDLG